MSATVATALVVLALVLVVADMVLRRAASLPDVAVLLLGLAFLAARWPLG